MTDLTDSMRLHAEACQRFCDLGEGVLKLAAEGKWDEIVETTADALNNVDAVAEGDEELYQEGKRQARYVASRAETVAVMGKLVVKPDEQRPYVLLVDCSAVVEDENDIELWVLEPMNDGTWLHVQSGEAHNLADCLYAIAACYTPSMQAAGREVRAQFRAESASEEAT